MIPVFYIITKYLLFGSEVDYENDILFSSQNLHKSHLHNNSICVYYVYRGLFVTETKIHVLYRKHGLQMIQDATPFTLKNAVI